MKLSQKRSDLLYGAINGAVMDARVKAVGQPQMTKSQVDDVLYDLEREIWKRVKESLGLHPML